MRRLAVAACLALVCLPDLADAASRARLCRRACGEVIAACIAEGRRPRACRRSTLRRCRRQGTGTCLVVATSTSLPPTTVRATTTVTTTSSTTTTSTTRPPQGLHGLLGTWDFTYSIVSTFYDRYVMSAVDVDGSGIPYILAYDVYDGRADTVVARPADLGFPTSPFEFALLDASVLFCDFFLFNKTAPNAVSGQYYLTDVDFDGSCGSIQNPGDPFPMTGARTPGVATAVAPSAGDAAVDAGGVARALAEVLAPPEP